MSVDVIGHLPNSSATTSAEAKMRRISNTGVLWSELKVTREIRRVIEGRFRGLIYLNFVCSSHSELPFYQINSRKSLCTSVSISQVRVLRVL